MMMEGGKMVSGLICELAESWIRDNASALLFLLPGRYVTAKLNRVKKSAHLA